MDRQADRQRDRKTDKQTKRQTNRQTDRLIDLIDCYRIMQNCVELCECRCYMCVCVQVYRGDFAKTEHGPELSFRLHPKEANGPFPTWPWPTRCWTGPNLRSLAGERSHIRSFSTGIDVG